MSIVDLRAWVEVAMIAFVVVLAVGRLLQKQEGLAAINAEAVARLTRQYDDTVARMAAKETVDREFVDIRGRFDQANELMSKLATQLSGLDARFHVAFVARDVCDARMAAVTRELNGDRPREKA